MKDFAFGARIALGAALAFGAALPAAPALATDYPTRPIHFILPFQPGGIVDFAGRVLGQKLGEVLGQPVIPENRPGAGGIVGVDYVAHSAPDGYDIVLIDPGIVANPTLQKSMPYDVFKDLVTVSIINSSPEVLVVTPQLGIKTYAELVAYGKANPGKLNYGSAGVGTTPHLAGEMWKARTGIDATHVPYKGIGPSYVDLMSGKIQMEFSSIAGALPFTSKGSVIAVATTGAKRPDVYPDIPTMEEAGLPGFEIDLWLGVYGPSKLPPDVLEKLNGGIAKALQDEDLKKAFAKFGLTPRGTTVAEGAAFTRSEYEKWKKVILDAHISLD
jgi:tripartite-type tricarboxylate transporter receptor subunit TctC